MTTHRAKRRVRHHPMPGRGAHGNYSLASWRDMFDFFLDMPKLFTTSRRNERF